MSDIPCVGDECSAYIVDGCCCTNMSCDPNCCCMDEGSVECSIECSMEKEPKPTQQPGRRYVFGR